MKFSVVHALLLFLSSVTGILLPSMFRPQTYKPVIIVHGLFDGPEDFTTLTEFIQKAHPGTEVTALDVFDDLFSVKPLWTQVKSFRSALEARLNQTNNGAHLLCFSQGGVICRALLSLIPNHNIHSFIALSSPLAGQYGDTDYIDRFFPKTLKKAMYKVCYNVIGQHLSICQYWKDPLHRELYLQYSNFLPFVNGERHHEEMRVWRKNFLKIKKLILIGGPDDGVITPWQSSHFGFYNSKEDVVEMKRQRFYRSDAFGLRTLDSRGDVFVCEQSGVEHTNWHHNRSVFTNCIQDWLV